MLNCFLPLKSWTKQQFKAWNEHSEISTQSLNSAPRNQSKLFQFTYVCNLHPSFTPYRDSLVCCYCSKCLFTGCLKSSREVKLGPNPRLTALSCLHALSEYPPWTQNCLVDFNGARLSPKSVTTTQGFPSYAGSVNQTRDLHVNAFSCYHSCSVLNCSLEETPAFSLDITLFRGCVVYLWIRIHIAFEWSCPVKKRLCA